MGSSLERVHSLQFELSKSGIAAACAALIALGFMLFSPLNALAREPILWKPKESNSLWHTECGSCHMAYPPAMLAAQDWLQIMAQLEQHYGVDARMDAVQREEITNYLDRNGQGKSEAPKIAAANITELPRITAGQKFMQKHQGAYRMLMKNKLKSMSDCLVCHVGVE